MSNESFNERLRLNQIRFDELLRELAQSFTPEAAAMLIERKFCRIDGVAVQLRLNDSSALIGLYIEICLPHPSHELEVSRRVLEAQAAQGTPATWIIGRNQESGVLVLVTHTALEAFGPGHAGDLLRHLEEGARIAKSFAQALTEDLS